MTAQVRQLLSPPRMLTDAPKPLLIGAFSFFIAALFASAFPDAPAKGLTSTAATFAMAAPAFFATLTCLGALRGTLAIASVGVFGYAIETFGVVTGLPYGDFVYSDALGAKFMGFVPYLLPVSYVPLVTAAVAATWRSTSNPALWILRATLLLVLIDGVLDPGAARLGFWVWEDGGAYYGIPLSNYFGWLVSGAVATFIFSRFIGNEPPTAGMLDGAVLGLGFWVGVSAFAGFILPVLLGAALISYLLLTRSALVRMRSERITS